MGKDAAPARALARLAAKRVADPYRHNPNLPTDRTLCAVLHHVGIGAPLGGSNAVSCGVYCANAYWLLRGDGKVSGALQNRKEARQQSVRVLRHFFENLPRLERVIAMGADSYAALLAYFGEAGDWRAGLMERRPVRADRLAIFASARLGHFGLGNRLQGKARGECLGAIKQDWKRAFDG